VSGTTSASDGTDEKTATATCTGGRKVVGGGYKIVSTIAGNPVPTITQATSDTVWSATAVETGGNPTWSIQAFAVCATVGT
jgi:hypothetical protein